MTEYSRTVRYYETDKMGITHHSNYIRWMEEARIDFMEKIGWAYDRLEADGIMSPVTALECRFLKSTTFPDRITIEVKVERFSGIRLKLTYRMKNESGEPVFEGTSEHCFLNTSGGLVSIKKEFPGLYQTLQEQTEE